MTIEGFFLNGKDITESLKVTRNAFADAPVLRSAVPASASLLKK